jgi:hypothetical protein
VLAAHFEKIGERTGWLHAFGKSPRLQETSY